MQQLLLLNLSVEIIVEPVAKSFRFVRYTEIESNVFIKSYLHRQEVLQVTTLFILEHKL